MSHNEPVKEILSAKDLGEMLGMSEGAVRTALYRGQVGSRIPAPIRMGRSVRWVRKEVDRWLEEKSREAQADYPLQHGEGMGAPAR